MTLATWRVARVANVPRASPSCHEAPFPTDQFGQTLTPDRGRVDDHLLHVIHAWELEHRLLKGLLDDRPQPSRTRPARYGGRRDGVHRLLREDQIHPVDGEHLAILLDQGVLGLGEDARQIGLGQLVEHADHGQTPDELGQQTEFGEVVGADLFEQFLGLDLMVMPGGPEAALVASELPATISLSPTNAPPQMNRMPRVSMVTVSWSRCLRVPSTGTEAIVPSSIFSSACCTPSPETSRVIDVFSPDFLAILSISSM